MLRGMDDRQETVSRWTLLTGHGHVLVEIARNPTARIRDIADAAGVTERTAQSIVADLEAAGYVARQRVGRRTTYTVNSGQPFRHQSQDGYLVGPLLSLLTADGGDAAAPAAPPRDEQDKQDDAS
jgi:hypothetical protein